MAVLYVNKPVGMTSFDVCFRLRKVLNTRKIGHTGTLDPNASGVMIILSDKDTKANQFLVSDRKEYECRVLLGIETDTLDIDGNILAEDTYTVPEREELEKVLASFLGVSMQEVPMTSAVKIDGKKLYEYQRQNREVEVPSREIEVSDIRLLKVHEDGFSFSCEVSSGTYIRALVRDILKKLGLKGTVLSLVRTAIDEIRLADCDDLEKIEEGVYRIHELKELLVKRYPAIEYSDEKDILNGKKIRIACEEDRVIILNEGRVLAVYEKDGAEYRCLRGLW